MNWTSSSTGPSGQPLDPRSPYMLASMSIIMVNRCDDPDPYDLERVLKFVKESSPMDLQQERPVDIGQAQRAISKLERYLLLEERYEDLASLKEWRETDKSVIRN